MLAEQYIDEDEELLIAPCDSTVKFIDKKFEELKEVISTIKDICQEFEDNNCSYYIEPSNDIRIKVMALQGKGEVFQDINMPFYLEINILKLHYDKK